MMKNKIFICLLFSLCLSTGYAIKNSEAAPKDENGTPLYTAYNLWYEKADSLWSINYKTGSIIPAGTPVKSVAVREKRNPEITFKLAENDREFTINFTPKYHPGLTIDQFKDRLFTDKDFKQLTKGLSNDEIDSIKQGVMKSGLSKKAVLIAYGYPPEHVTSSTNENAWTYWMNRFKKKVINFNEKGLTFKKDSSSDEL